MASVRSRRCKAGALTLVLLVLAVSSAAGKRPKKQRLEELMNPLLSPQHALWLAGPISWMASEEEIETYTGLTDDTRAEAFIEEFWRRRDPEPRYPRNPARERFEERATEADRLFREAGIPGRRTDRGTIYVLYGPPAEEDHEISKHPDDPPILIWKYPADAPKGLDGESPERYYRFIKRGELTTFYTPNTRPPRRRPNWP